VDVYDLGVQVNNIELYESYIEPDCLVLEGNAVNSRLSTYKMDVDYSNNTIPVNQQLILSGSAVRFPIPDSYYTSLNHITSRYLGSKYSGQYNLSSSYAPLATPIGYPIDNFVNYFVYFDWIGGSNPQYPGGGNVHCTYLIDTEGKAIPLTGKNEYLSYVENIFKKDTLVDILPAVYSAGNTSNRVEVIEGGALYNTIIYITGSSPDGRTIDLFSTPETGGDQTTFEFIFTTSSVSILTDSASVSPFSIINNGLYALQVGENSYGPLDVIGSNRSGVGIFNNATGVIAGENNTPVYFPYKDSLFPLQVGDFIRFGNTGSYDLANLYALDGTFQANGLLRIKNIELGLGPSFSSSIEITPIITNPLTSSLKTPFPGVYGYQNFRIFRRIPTETFVLIKNKPSYTDPGFLIPENFNPNFDPYELARKAGLIS
jgi:hypothetical protein